MRDVGRLEIRVLGDLQVGRGGRAQPLPDSKKTRALLGYLVSTGTPHLRERLCDLFWDGPDDPRAALRWSLTKIRPLLNDAATTRLLADRERVAFVGRNTEIDAARVRELLGSDVAAASTEALKAAVGLFRGEFLEGLELPSCFRYHEWCMGEREAWNAARLVALSALLARLHDSPTEALGYARAMVAADPLSETSHAAVVRALGELGRVRAALDQYEHARRLLERELAAPLSGELEQARQAVDAPRAPRPRPVPRAAASAPDSARPREPLEAASLPLVGRHGECAVLDRCVAAAGRGEARQVVLVSGEPGIGKSRMLAYVRERVLQAGGTVLRGCGFEAEMPRPYGAWIDLLRAVSLDDVPGGVGDELGLLRPEVGPLFADVGTQVRLFDSVVGLLRQTAGERLLAVLFDDVQWLDQSSASLLHYALRAFAAPSSLLFICAARRGELEDNAAMLGVTQSLTRERRIVELKLGPLNPEDSAALARAVDPSLDASAVSAESGGNPLYILELARAWEGREDAPSRTLDALIMGHLARVDARARDLLVWAAALGRRFTLDLLARAADFETADLLAALGELERRGILRPTEGDEYDFTHDLIRQVTYRSISQPRRRLVHRQIARAIAAAREDDASLVDDLAHHALLAGEHALAAAACVTAGERCLRLFANAEASALAEQGLGHLDQMRSGADRLRLHIALLRVKILAAAGPGLRRLPEVAERLTQAVSSAQAAGLYAEAATGYYLLSVLHQESGEPSLASESTLSAAAAAAAADRATHARQLANTARCLAELEQEMARARSLLAEAGAIVQPLGLEIAELYWGQGLLQRWDGDLETASSLLERALGLARRAEDRWREYKCLTWLAMIERERGAPDRAHARCVELGHVAARMGDQDVPFARAIMVLAQLAAGQADGTARLAGALAALREIDDKSHLAYALNGAAEISLAAGHVAAARALAEEALAAAAAVRRRSEGVIAESLLARAAVASGDPSAAADQVARLLQEAADPYAVSARARAAIAAAAQAVGRPPPTPVPTARCEP
jgi:DNA-binding SARP family transcriptional activator